MLWHGMGQQDLMQDVSAPKIHLYRHKPYVLRLPDKDRKSGISKVWSIMQDGQGVYVLKNQCAALHDREIKEGTYLTKTTKK